MPSIQHARGTRAGLDALASSGEILPGQVYVLTDEDRIAVGLTSSTYETFAKESEAGGGGGEGVPVGGTTGQVLAKASATDYDTEWIAPPAGGGGGAPTSFGTSNQTVLGASNTVVFTLSGAANTVYPLGVSGGLFLVGSTYFATTTVANGASYTIVGPGGTWPVGTTTVTVFGGGSSETFTVTLSGGGGPMP
jgi:hypothetical protein